MVLLYTYLPLFSLPPRAFSAFTRFVRRVMRLVLLRHAAAEDRYVFHMNSDGAPESKRPLTNAGIDRMKLVGKGLYKSLDGDIQRIVSSPYTRAVQTAQLFQEAIPENQRPQLEVSDLLTPGCSFHTVNRWLRGETGTVVLVGHEPDMGWLMQEFCGAQAQRAKFGKAGACLISFNDHPGNSEGVLQWFLSPSILHKLGSQ